ncbi:MAG: hypothetical protein D8M58_21800 [Calditrichaeota bacterium]|nr:MAG: hypothetical protein DWQ03_00675 [Calditrichota bacterium]MBL1208050.1 hypothetical protein [Calditrichota bacterium]NOG47885.1 hypothetical protein [Calditrichota bacterium]
MERNRNKIINASILRRKGLITNSTLWSKFLTFISIKNTTVNYVANAFLIVIALYFMQLTGFWFVFHIFILSISVFLVIITGINSDRQKDTISDRNKIRTRLNDFEEFSADARIQNNKNIKKLADSMLRIISTELFNIRSNERITLYYHDSTEEKFYNGGRFSKSPVYNSSSSRQAIPDNQGAVGNAWAGEGDCYVGSLPPSGTNKYYEALKRRFNIEPETAKSLTMKSRCYYAKAISQNEIRIGIIVFESLIASAFSKHKTKINETINTYEPIFVELIRFLINQQKIQRNFDKIEGQNNG